MYDESEKKDEAMLMDVFAVDMAPAAMFSVSVPVRQRINYEQLNGSHIRKMLYYVLEYFHRMPVCQTARHSYNQMIYCEWVIISIMVKPCKDFQHMNLIHSMHTDFSLNMG